MAVQSLLDLTDALARSEFETILGTDESSWIDFKKGPYPLDRDKSKWELAKDVSAFANTGAGAILIGMETELDSIRRVETASSLRQIRSTPSMIQAIRSVVKDWIYPRVRDFDVRWYATPEELGTGYVLLHVPAQTETDRPFVIRRMADGEERGSVGIAERDGADTVWWTAERVHHLIQQSRSGPMSIENSRVGASEEVEHDSERLNNLLRRNEAVQGWVDEPILHLQAIPPRQGVRLPNFYNRDGLWGALNEPRQLRSGGWNLRTSFPPEVDEGGLVCQSPGNDVLRLEPDGVFTLSGIADVNYLCWAMDVGREQDEPLSLNPVALVEWVYSFFMFVNDELKGYVPGQWTYRLVALRFQTGNIGLFPGLPRGFRSSTERASSDEWIQEFPEDVGARETFGLGAHSTGEEAFMALDHLYGLFGLGNDVIPFAEGQTTVISAEKINSLR